MLSIIVAADENNVIGKDNSLIWHLPNDLRYFKNLTLGKTIIMGRNTYEAIGRPLPERRNIIVTRNLQYKADGCQVVHSLEEALQTCTSDTETFIIGGAQIYRQALPLAHRIYLTRVHQMFEGDRHFPELGPEWKETERTFHPADEKHPVSFTFLTYERG